MKDTLRFWRNCILFSLFFLGLLHTPLLSKSQTNKTVITGKVMDEAGNPPDGATVTEKGTTNRTAAKADGSFSISISARKSLIVSAIGYADKELATSGSAFLSVSLASKAAKDLDEVVVIGYGTQRKGNVT